MREFRRPSDVPLPPDWHRGLLGESFSRVTRKNLSDSNNVVTISAELGIVNQAEYFNRIVASDNRRGYTLLRRGEFAYNKSYSAGYPVGAICRLDRYDDGALSPLYICFRLDTTYVDSDYAKTFFEAGMADGGLASVADQGAREHGLLNVGIDDFFGIGFWYPPVHEQRRIAEILDTVDEVIRKTEQVIAKLRLMKQGLLHDLLTRGIDEHGELRDPERHPEQFKDSPLGQAPLEWEVMRLGELARLQGGFAFSSTCFGGGPIPVIRMSDLRAGALEISGAARVAPTFLKSHNDFVLQQGDLLIGMSGSLENTAVVEPKHLPALLNQRVGRFVLLRPDRLRYRLLSLYVASTFYARQLRQEAVGAAQLNISSRQVEGTVVPLPLLSEQDAILERWAAETARYAAEASTLSKLRIVKRGLMDDLLTGRVRVTVPGEAAA